MKLFYKSLAIILAIILIDILVGFWGNGIITKLNRENYVGDAALLNYSLNKATADVIIVGSSTALCHYDPSIIKDSLSKYAGRDINVFNAGASTQGMAYADALIKSVIKRERPLMIILDLQQAFLFNDFTPEQQSTLRPYYGYNECITQVFDNHISTREKLLLKSNMYRLNTNFLRLATSFFKEKGSNGFYIHEGELECVPSLIEEPLPHSFNDKSRCEFIDFAKYCKDNGVILIAIVSPYFNHVFTSPQAVEMVQDLCNQEGVPLLDFKNDTTFQHKEYFFDQRHMNVEGARKFTRMICPHLKSFFD